MIATLRVTKRYYKYIGARPWWMFYGIWMNINTFMTHSQTRWCSSSWESSNENHEGIGKSAILRSCALSVISWIYHHWSRYLLHINTSPWPFPPTRSKLSIMVNLINFYIGRYWNLASRTWLSRPPAEYQRLCYNQSFTFYFLNNYKLLHCLQYVCINTCTIT